MADYLPPLNALRAFDAAARHMSFAKAAEELTVTPSALSIQIKNLEAHLGAPVFRRLNRAIELTELGRLLHPNVSDGFNSLMRGWRSARRSLDDSTLTITAGPAFTAKWLAPRMFSFVQANRDIELRFSASLRMMDFERDEVDLAIRFGGGDDAGLFSEDIHEEWVTPMMHPDLAAKYKSPEDLLDAPLIHDESTAFLTPRPDWATWFGAVGLHCKKTDHGPRFSNADHAIDLALEGGGVVLGRSSITERALTAGRLVAPFQPALKLGVSYRLVCPMEFRMRPAVATFHAWIIDEMEALRKLTVVHDPVDLSLE